MNQYFVYILTNKGNSVIYTGVTNNLIRRVLEHKSKSIEGFTKKYNISKLVYYESFNNIEEAIAGEKKIKGRLKIKKIKLISQYNPSWKDLYEVIFR